MTSEDKLKTLLREHSLAVRKIKARRVQWMLFKIRLGEMMFWRKTDYRNSPLVNQKIREMAPEMLDSRWPPPRDALERELNKKNRRLAVIEAEIAAIPPVTVTKTAYAPDALPSFGGKTVVMCRLGKRRDILSGYFKKIGKDVSECHEWKVTSYSDFRDEDGTLVKAICATSAHLETTVSITLTGFPAFPMRSTARFEERQNIFQPGDCPCDGRHFNQALVLSDQLYKALIEHLSLLDGVQGKFEQRHVLCLASDRDDLPRKITAGDPAPLIQHAPRRLKELLIVEMSSQERGAGIVNALVLTESE